MSNATFEKFAAEASHDEEPIEWPIRDRSGEQYTGKAGKPITVQLMGEYSRAYRDAERKELNRTIKRARRGDDQYDAVAAEKGQRSRIAAAAVGWNLEDEAGAVIPFSRDNVMAFLEAAPWEVVNWDRGIKSHADFFKRDSGT